jgi:signal transduction histidine kinase
LELAVTNSGDMIPASMIEQLLRLFVRAAAQPNQQGLDLGLYIASEIARAHGGTLTATSTPDETRFTFTMPVR